jgi:predicted metal-dependent enzyme (double-stranded beta helix superfamily)
MNGVKGMDLSQGIQESLQGLLEVSSQANPVEFSVLTQFLKGDNLDFGAFIGVANPDSSNPYGRQVLVNTPALEVMVASWTRGMVCAPHDHGGSLGAVRVLQGRARHWMWRCEDGQLSVTHEETVEAGGVMSCGANLIHSMGDDGAELPLVTLHMYTAGIDHMVVYDVQGERTLVVDGGCGAWVPTAEPQMIRHEGQGFLSPKAVR